MQYLGITPRTNTARIVAVHITSHVGKHYLFPGGTTRRCDLDSASPCTSHYSTEIHIIIVLVFQEYLKGEGFKRYVENGGLQHG